ncbi:hypothetical protein OIO90_006401 [Microbotryomycetes sp. JL221]|nr:hypothetical protein OIO90_006401 [Microbotryomycetes sp. JL221]
MKNIIDRFHERSARSRQRTFGITAAAAFALASVGVTTVQAQSGTQSSLLVKPRWAQSTLLLTPDDTPTLLAVSGKLATTGQTIDSTPATASTVSLDLSQPISNLSSPPWIVSAEGTGPTSSSASAVALSSTSALYFGGDASSDPSVTSPLLNDSSWLLTCSDTNPPLQSWIHATRNWAQQPVRRELVYIASASNGTLSRAWIFGGQRTDKSGITFNELWEAQVELDDNGNTVPASGQWRQWVAGNDDAIPPNMWDGQAIVMTSSQSKTNMPSIWLIGGVQLYDDTDERSVSMSNLWVFTPSSRLGQGSWDVIPISGPSPTGRRGHVAVDIGGGKIWIQGGRSLDGATVMSDSAVLDTVARRWSKANGDGEAVWGHSAEFLGETVVMAFGYGQRAPATTALTVYAPGNDTYLDAYYPSYDTIVANPKASSTSGTPSTPTIVVDPTEYPSNAPTTQSVTQSLASTLLTQQSAATVTSKKPTGTMNPWVAPGGPTQTTRQGANRSSSQDKDSSDTTSTTPTQVVAGAVVGSLLGALALVAVGVLVIRRHKQRQGGHGRRYSPYEGSWARWTSNFRNDDDLSDGKSSLVAGPRYDVSKRSSFYNDDESMSEKPLPSMPQTKSGVQSAKAVMVGLFTAAQKRIKSTPRMTRGFHNLSARDDEETVWDQSTTNVTDLPARQFPLQQSKPRWTTFEGAESTDELVADDTIRGRGGRGVWEGYEFGGAQSHEGSIVTDTMRTSTSFLGSALGGFASVATSDDELERPRPHVEAGDDDLARALSRIDEEEGSEDGDRYGSASAVGMTIESGNTRSTDSTRLAEDPSTALTRETSASTYSTQTGPSAAARELSGSTPARPFSPVKSLYGSTFNSPALMPFMTNRKTSRSSSGGSLTEHQRNNSSWWGRLSRKSTVDVATATANEAIRDPASPPSLDVVVGNLSRSVTDASDPFSDSSASTTRENRKRAFDATRPDEQGRFSVDVLRRSKSRRSDNPSTSSRASSDVTATSSVLEERMRTMDVVQRVRTGSGSTTSVELTPTLGRNEGFGRLPESAEEELEDVEMEDVAFTNQTPGRVNLVLTPNDEVDDPFSDPMAFRHSRGRSGSDANSPSKQRLLGPRSLPLSPSMLPEKRRAPLTAGTAGVRAMVQQIESRSSSPQRCLLDATPPRSQMSASRSMSSFVVANEPQSPSRAALTSSATSALSRPDRSRSMADVSFASQPNNEERRPKVAHKLARKPVLYVANPDQ